MPSHSTSFGGSEFKRIVVWLSGLLAAAVGGCAKPQAAEPVHRIWPPPPAPARIRLEQIIRQPADLGNVGFWEKVGQALAGASQQQLGHPQSTATTADGRLFIADPELQGVHVFRFGSGQSQFLAQAGDEFFVSPVGLATWDETLAVADSALKKVFLLDLNGKLLRTIDKPGGFRRPTGLAYDARHDQLLVVDTLANEICAFDREGKLVRRLGKSGMGPGQFNYPTYLFADAEGKLYVTDSLNFRIQIFDPTGRHLFDIGELGDATGYMAVPKGVGVDRRGHIFVVDSYLTTVQVFDQEGRFLLAFGEHGDRPGGFLVPTGLTVDGEGRILVCDSQNGRVQVFRYIGEDDETLTDDR